MTLAGPQSRETSGDDLLSELLSPLRLRGVFASRWTVHAPWGVHGDREDCAVLHYVRRGECAVTPPGPAEPVVLRPGDLAIFPNGAPHELADRPGRATTPLEALVPGRHDGTTRLVRLEGDGPVTELLCGGLRYERAAVPPIYRALPPVLVLDRRTLAGEPLLADTLERLAGGMDHGAPGTRLVALRAFELVFVLALRAALRRPAEDCPALRALGHPQIGRALLAVQTRYAEPWTLESLAREAGMSRSAFAAAFRRLVGLTPARYLADRRMQEAARLLTETATPLTGVAERVGYASAVGFHLAFRRHYGMTPGRYRGTPTRADRPG
jgi:AraC-like DNA-binding protein